MTRWSPFDLPFELHTNRELEFMLNRGKPLAHFCDVYPPEPGEECIPQSAFAPFVADGTFEMCAFIQISGEPAPPQALQARGVIHVFYARPSEVWRIDAYIAMLGAGARAGWSEGLERLQGHLLGYTEAETDAHIAHRLKSPHARDLPWLMRLRSERRKWRWRV